MQWGVVGRAWNGRRVPVLAPAEAPPAVGHVDVLVLGGGACGQTAALSARNAGASVLIVERDADPRGTTAMSTGLIPAAATPEQAAAGIDDSAERMTADIQAKAGGRADADVVAHLAAQSPATVAWLQRHGVPLSLVIGFRYPGHSVMRMMGTPHRTGSELMAALAGATAAAGADLLADAQATHLIATDGRVVGAVVVRPDGAREAITAAATVVATSGFGGDAALVRRHIPEIAGAVFHGHPGNRGDALAWGQALGAATADMDAYQGHGGLAAGHGIPILWPLIVEGGFQVNADGRRFSNEAAGYSEQAARVVAEPGGFAWSIFDARLDTLMRQFDDYRDALAAGAIVTATSVAALAATTGLPALALEQTIAEVDALTRGGGRDAWGRAFAGKPPLAPPWHAVRVTGALFHTQGGLVVDRNGRVLRADTRPVAGLYAFGGAARGISGPGAAGYIAGNGLLTATTGGRLAGMAAAREALDA